MDPWISPLFWAVIEATEEAIVNALVAARTMTGRDGITAHALPHDRLRRIVATWDAMERDIERDATAAAGPPPCR